MTPSGSKNTPVVHWMLALWLLVCAAPHALAQSNDLPWNRGGTSAQGKGVSPRTLLALVKIEDADWNRLEDGRGITDEERPTLNKLLYRLPRFDPPQWERWCTSKAELTALTAEPMKHHGEATIVTGRAKRVEKIELLAPIDDFTTYYRVTIAAGTPAQTLVVYTRAIPKLWGDAETIELDEPIRVQAIFLKAGADELDFVAARIGWLPDQPNEKLGVTADHVWLAKHGLDIALWDDLRGRNGAPLAAADNETFYQLLTTLSKAAPQDKSQLAGAPLDLAPILTTPDDVLGRVYDCSAIARRVQKIIVPESFRARFGLDHYYEIDVLIPLDKQAIRLAPPPGKPDAAPTYLDGFPATFCVATLPPDLVEGERVHKAVQIKGVFFRVWSYQSDYVEKFDKNLRQPAPLLMGVTTDVVAADGPVDWGLIGPTGMLVCIIVGVAALWFATWRAARGDRKFAKNVLRKYTGGGAKTPGKFQMPRRDDPPA